jgi:hypothetical protein
MERKYKIEMKEILEREVKDLKDLSDVGKLNELIGIFKVLTEEESSFSLNASEEYIRTLLKSLKESQILDFSRKVKEMKEIKGKESLSIETFFQMYGRYLGCTGVQSLLLNLTPFIREGALQLQALYVLNNLVRGLRSGRSTTVEENRFLRKLFKDIVGFQLNRLPLSYHQEHLLVKMQELKPWNHLGDFYVLEGLEKRENTMFGVTGTQDYERNAMVQSLFLEFLGALSGVIGKDFEPFLIDGLYPILEKLNKSNEEVSMVSWNVLSEISQHMGLEGTTQEDKIKNLLVKNVDYIINHVSRNLRQFELYPYAPNVLSASIRIIGPPILDFLDDSLLELLDLLGEYHNVNENVVQVLLDVFHALADVMAKDSSESKQFLKVAANDVKKLDLSSEFGHASHELISFFLKNRNSKRKDELDEEDAIKSAKEFFLNKGSDFKGEKETVEEDEDNETKEKEVEPTISKDCKFAGLILPKLTHFLTVDSPFLRKYVIELLGKMVPFLEEREPFIHSVWTSLVNRLNDSQYFIVEEALSVISKISNLSPDFVSKRISEDIIPKALIIFSNLNRELEEYSKSSANGLVISNVVSGNVNYSKKFNIMLRILDLIQNLLESISVNYFDTNNLTQALVTLLNQDYPAKITLCAISMLRQLLSKSHGDLVYLHLWTACCASEIIPFNSNLKKLSIPARMIQQSGKYILNASAVLDHPLTIDWEEAVVVNGVWKRNPVTKRLVA